MCFSKKGENQVVIAGTATLCFDGSGTWFQGSISTDDNSQFAIYGNKSHRRGLAHSQLSYSEDTGFSLEDDQAVPVIFDIRVVDHEVGEEYSLKRVFGKNGEICTFKNSSICFNSQEVYKGHRADLISQQCLGHKMDGENAHVYKGPITLSCVPTPRNVHWVL